MLCKALQRPDGLHLDLDVRGGVTKLGEHLDLFLSRDECALEQIAHAPEDANGDVPHLSPALLAGDPDFCAYQAERAPDGFEHRTSTGRVETKAGRTTVRRGRHGKEDIIQALESADVDSAERRRRRRVRRRRTQRGE